MAKRFRKHKPSVREGAVALHDHILTVAAIARRRYDIDGDPAALGQMLADREIVRYPVTLVFDDKPLESGEFAYPQLKGGYPSEGFSLYIHPHFQDRGDVLPLLVGYQLVRINYGDVASHEEAEVFGAALCGMDRDAYYDRICALADSISGTASPHASAQENGPC